MSHKKRAYPKVGYQYQQQQQQQQAAALGGAPGPQYGQYAAPSGQYDYQTQAQAQAQAPGLAQAPGVSPQPAQGFGGQPGYPAQGYPAQGYPAQGYPAQPGAQGYPAAQPGYPATPGFNAPAAQGYGPDQAAAGIQSMQLGYQPGSYAGLSNQLYLTDLLQELPPPISDLSLPPPPIVLPHEALITRNPELNASPEFFRCTLNAVPTTSSLLKKLKLPLAVVVRPYVTLHEKDHPVPVVLDTLIARCRRCRLYINPFVKFAENGHRWRCNFCNLLNDVPTAFDYNGTTGQSLNRYERHELNYGVVEFLAPPEYMVRPPQPLVYVFVLEVTATAVNSGLLATAARTILESLDNIPNEGERTKVAFIGVDSSLHFFKIPLVSESEEGADPEDEEPEPEMLVVPDLDEPFLPAADDLLVNLLQARKNVERLLNNINNMFVLTQNTKFALGPALKSALKLCQSCGGKIEVILSSLPNIGLGALKLRDEESFYGKPKEALALLTNANLFYKLFAVECNKSQVTVDMFLALNSYMDVALLLNLPRYTAGQTHYYPAWLAAREGDVAKLLKELLAHLLMEVALEAVLRVRGLNGLRMLAFYGNFFNRLLDLCLFPTFPRDQLYVIEMLIEEHILKPTVALQAAILHTTLAGERRIRVMTLTIPTTQNINEVYALADQLAILAYIAHKAVEKTLLSLLHDARDLVDRYLSDILSVYKKDLVPGNVGTLSPLQLLTNLKMLPLLLYALRKHIALRPGRVPLDHRSAGLNFLSLAPLPRLVKGIYPLVYCLHEMEDTDGLPSEETGEIVLPKPMNAAGLLLQTYGLYLFDNGQELFLWVGGDAIPELCQDVFGISDIYQVAVGKHELPVVEDSDLNLRVRNIIAKIRENKTQVTYQLLHIVRGGSAREPPNLPNLRELAALRIWALSLMVEDRLGELASYKEYLSSMREKISN